MSSKERQFLRADFVQAKSDLEDSSDFLIFGVSSYLLIEALEVCIASLEAPQPEPVAYTSKAQLDYLHDGFGGSMWNKGNVPLYTAPPAPVMQPIRLQPLPEGRAINDRPYNLRDEHLAIRFMDISAIRAAGYPVEE